MSGLFRDSSAAWVALLVIALPVLIIGIGEVEERLRQRDSDLRGAVAILRIWVVPLAALLVLGRTVFDLADDGPFARLVGTGLLLASGLAALSALTVVVGRLRTRPRQEGRRSLPRLLLAVPRLAVILTTAWILIAGVWAVDLSAALTALGVTSLVISFALQDTLSGIASGFLLVADQPFQPGDWIKAGDVEGQVVDINWRTSHIRTRDDDLIIVPNGELARGIITNFDSPTRRHRVVVSLQVAFRNPPTAAKNMLLDAARATPGVLADPPPEARVVQIDDPLMGYEVHLWIDDYAIAPRVKSDFGSLVWYYSHRHDVPLPSPAQDLYLYDGVEAGLAGRVDRAEMRRRLTGSPLLAELDDDILDAVAASASAARYAKDETIMIEGETTDLVVLHHGSARLMLRGHDEELAVLTLEPGELFGVLDQSDSAAHRPVVVATTDCEVVRIAAKSVGDLMSRAPALSSAIEQLRTVRRRRIARILRRAQTIPAAAEPGVTDAVPASGAGPAGDGSSRVGW